MFKCKYCNKEIETKKGLSSHECRCSSNPDKINLDYLIWSKGKTKEESPLLKQMAISRSKSMKGIKRRKWTEEEKHHLRDKRIAYLKLHPDKVPYLLNHSSNISYPEKYFICLFKKENINLKYHKQIGLYQLDFYNEDKKLYVEIDGDQHYLDKKIFESDLERTHKLEHLGWKCYYRIKWSSYKQMSLEEKNQLMLYIKKEFGLSQTIDNITNLNINKKEIDTINNKYENKKHYCVDCGKEIFKTSIRCRICSNKLNGTIKSKKLPTKETLIEDLYKLGFIWKVAKKYSVTTMTIKRWCKKRNIITGNKAIYKEQYQNLHQ